MTKFQICPFLIYLFIHEYSIHNVNSLKKPILTNKPTFKIDKFFDLVNKQHYESGKVLKYLSAVISRPVSRGVRHNIL